MKNKKKYVLMVALIMTIMFLGSAYAFFSFTAESENNVITTGEVYLNYENASDSITLTNAFPETMEHARNRNDNIMTFDIVGRDTYDMPIYYEFDLIEGDPITGKTRIDPKYLRFDLKEDGNLLISNMTYNDLNNHRMFVSLVPANTSSNIIHSYELRMWLCDEILISDTDPNATYSTDEFIDLYASVKLRIYGDFLEKSAYGVMGSSLPDGILSKRPDITKVQFKDDTYENILSDYNDAEYKGEATYSPTTINNSNTNYKVKKLDTTPDPIFEESNFFFPTTNSFVYMWLENDPINTGKYILNIAAQGDIYLTNCNALFSSFNSLKVIDFGNAKTDFVTNMAAMFYNCSSLTNLDLSGLNTSNVINMITMFYNCSSLTNLDLSGLNTSSVTNMSTMFYNCSNLANLNLSGLNTSNVTDMGTMFYNCSSLTNLDLSSFDTSNVINFGGIFFGTNLTNLNISGWDFSSKSNNNLNDLCFPTSLINLNLSNAKLGNVVLSNLFNSNYSGLDTLDFSGWKIDTLPSLVSLGVSGLTTTLNLSNWEFDSSITSLSGLFSNMSWLQHINVSGWNTENITNMDGLFNSCSSLKELDLSSWDTSNVESMASMFYGCNSLETLNISSFVFSDGKYSSCEYSLSEFTPSQTGYLFSNVGLYLPSGTYTTIYTKDIYQSYWILKTNKQGSNGHNVDWDTNNVKVYVQEPVTTNKPICTFTDFSNKEFGIYRGEINPIIKLRCYSKDGFSDSDISPSDFYIPDDNILTYNKNNLFIAAVSNKNAITNGYEYSIRLGSTNSSYYAPTDYSFNTTLFKIALKQDSVKSNSNIGNDEITSKYIYNFSH